MKADALSRYRCPECGPAGVLSLERSSTADTGEVLQGTLACAHCKAAYPVERGVPRFVAPENYAVSFGMQWNRHPRTQLDSFSGLPISRERLFAVSGWPARMAGELVLEAGSGAGRFTEVLAGTGATVYSFDFSSAADANYDNNGRAPNVHLAQADILRMPFAPGEFDKVMCLGVLQHTPQPREAFASLARQVRPGGELVVDVYTRRLASLMQWKYLLRPLTKRMHRETLYRWVSMLTPALVPPAALLRRLFGRAGARLIPIVEYSHLGLPRELNREWAILDTFDMYAPAHDHPQSLATVRRWYEEAGFERIAVGYGPNGVVGKGCRPARTPRA